MRLYPQHRPPTRYWGATPAPQQQPVADPAPTAASGPKPGSAGAAALATGVKPTPQPTSRKPTPQPTGASVKPTPVMAARPDPMRRRRNDALLIGRKLYRDRYGYEP